ncbi:hypothetical protein ACFLZB_00280 [Nanoarchaeota archaeon]
MSKRGSLNLSIQVIVIIVIAMTLLGLGLAFVRSQFSQITSIGTDVQQQVKEQITAQLRTSGEQVDFPRDIKMNRRESKVLTLGVQNTGGSQLNFKIDMSWDLENSDFNLTDTDPDDFELRWDKGCLQMSPADAQVFGIRAEAVPAPGTYALRANVIEYPGDGCTGNTTSIYATKLSFVTVG